MENVYVKQLRPHPMNDQLFDPMPEDVWPDFCKSIKERGIIEPLVIDQKNTIISGHQRIRACKVIGYTGEVPVIRNYYATEDDRLKDLIEINILQRGEIKDSPKKEALRISILERIYGITRGNNQHKEDATNGPILTQEQLAEKLGLSVKALQRAKKLAELPEEIQDMVDSGKISLSTAVRVIAGLSPEEQAQLIEQLPAKDKLTSKDVEAEVAKIKAEYEARIEAYESDIQQLNEKEKKLTEELKAANPPSGLGKDAEKLTAKINSFMKDFSGYSYIADHADELSEVQRKKLVASVQNIGAWTNTILDTINEKENSNGDC